MGAHEVLCLVLTPLCVNVCWMAGPHWHHISKDFRFKKGLIPMCTNPLVLETVMVAASPRGLIVWVMCKVDFSKMISIYKSESLAQQSGSLVGSYLSERKKTRRLYM